MSRARRILLVGPLPRRGDVVGGTKVSFAGMVHALGEVDGLELRVFDTSRARVGRGRLRRAFDEGLAFARLMGTLLAPWRRPDVVVFNTSPGGLLKSGPAVRLACSFRRVALVTRVFGGDLDLFMERAPRWLARLAERTILRSELVLLQTGALCARFGDRRFEASRGSSVRWWPTTRDLPAPTKRPEDHGEGTGARAFLLLGQLRAEKGVPEAIAASHALPEGARLTVVGPTMPGYDVTGEDLGPRCSVRGPVAPEEVPSVLAEHDVLLLPSTHEGEGMPGIVVEAMQSGLTVITTDWRSLPELVCDGENGRVVPPRDTAALAGAMVGLAQDKDLLRRLRNGARATGEALRTDRWTPVLVDWLGALAEDRLAKLADPPALRGPGGRAAAGAAESTEGPEGPDVDLIPSLGTRARREPGAPALHRTGPAD